MAAARRLAALPAFAFAQTKTQMRQPVIERLERSGAAIDKIATESGRPPKRSAASSDYVARTLKKG